MRNAARILVLALALLAVALYMTATALDLLWLKLASKPWPILALMAWVATVRYPDEEAISYGRWVLGGLAFCLLGDMLLELEGCFLYGVGAFLTGHLGYLGAFLGSERRARPLLAVPFAGWGLALYFHLLPGLGPMTVPLAVYAAVLCSMMWRAFSCAVGRGGAVVWLAACGALAFGISDSMIAVNRFGGGIPHGRYPIMALYWIGQTGIAASAVLALRPSNRR